MTIYFKIVNGFNTLFFDIIMRDKRRKVWEHIVMPGEDLTRYFEMAKKMQADEDAAAVKNEGIRLDS